MTVVWMSCWHQQIVRTRSARASDRRLEETMVNVESSESQIEFPELYRQLLVSCNRFSSMLH